MLSSQTVYVLKPLQLGSSRPLMASLCELCLETRLKNSGAVLEEANVTAGRSTSLNVISSFVRRRSKSVKDRKRF
jgi:hypothetical protein